jgi:O-antigen/teichoic acid export membrane protein
MEKLKHVLPMSRLKNFSRNLATSYLQLGVNVIYSLVSVPLILHWLPKAEFGLWAVLVQMMGYVSIIDLGMTSAAARLLVDHKDDRMNGNYGSLVKVAFCVSVLQGVIIFAVIALGAPWLAEAMKIQPEYASTFILLLRLQGLITAFNFALRPLSTVLYAHQRMDVQANSSVFTLLASLALLVLFLWRGCGIISFIYANAITAAVVPIYLFSACRKLGFLPKAHEWGRASWARFQEVFLYGKDIFLFSLGQQLTTASQLILVTRTLGLEMAAAWAVGTKIFNLFTPLMCRPYGAALPGLYEMQVRGETERLRARFKDIVLLTASLGAFLGVSFALCNSLFVSVWLNHKIFWPLINDVLLGLWLFIISLQTTHINIVNVTKQFGMARFIYFLEGCFFVALVILLNGRLGLAGIIGASILCTLLFSYQYGLRLSGRHFHCGFKELAVDWVRPSLKLALSFGLFAVIVWFATLGLPILWRLVIHVLLAIVVGGLMLLRIGFPAAMMKEAGTRLPVSVGRTLQWLVACRN